MPALPPITQALLLINVALFAADMLLGRLLTELFALWPLGSGRFMPWQVVSYGFLHGSFGHLFFNMLGLWMFGAELERIWGGKRYLQFYMASVLTAALTQLLVGLFSGGAPTVGASGGLFGLLLAFGMMFPNRTIMPLFPPIPMKAKTFVMVFGGLELLFGVTGTASGVAHFAHLGGMLGGFLMIRYWRGQPPFGRR
ncbi:rhomboid family intramembrane serine protease [Piscinibacter aquaticus]|uniref:Rhomboid family intramembrane serine protease n=1 Tax=Piscinibacter aquaticus TaxID=392597 RepID=A0A5C6TYC9_9BURK|nr:rhomboid family intramembrane serine protease [Piscinibacter aquaticus]